MNTKYPVKVIVNGFKGKMGQMLFACAPRFPWIEIIGGWDDQVISDPCGTIEDADVVIDFSAHLVTPDLARRCAGHAKAMIIGTTGHTAEEIEVIKHCSGVSPTVMTSNFSCGANLLFDLVRQAVIRLGLEFDIEVVEMHHRMKKDAPSGTATALVKILKEVRDRQLASGSHSRQRGTKAYITNGRSGETGQRDSCEICVHALRGGDVFGDHTVIFAGNGERLELTHRASSREAFANGALLAAEWVVGKPPGMYNMQDVLGLK